MMTVEESVKQGQIKPQKQENIRAAAYKLVRELKAITVDVIPKRNIFIIPYVLLKFKFIVKVGTPPASYICRVKGKSVFEHSQIQFIPRMRKISPEPLLVFSMDNGA